jgi:chromosome partitioning protein
LVLRIERDDLVRTIAVMNQKGGVGKTTTSVNLAAGLAATGRRVCLVDLDPQAHACLHLGVEAEVGTPSLYDVMLGRRTLIEIRRQVAESLWVVPGNVDLAGVERELAVAAGRETVLRDALRELETGCSMDYCLIDCPPSLGVLTINALAGVGEVFITLQPHFLALQGLSKLLETAALVSRRLNRELKISGIVLCLFETGTRLAADISDDLGDFFEASDPQAPWAGATIFESRIRRNIRLAEAAGFGKSIFDYDPDCNGSVDYRGLVQEVIASEPSGGVARAA